MPSFSWETIGEEKMMLGGSLNIIGEKEVETGWDVVDGRLHWWVQYPSRLSMKAGNLAQPLNTISMKRWRRHIYYVFPDEEIEYVPLSKSTSLYEYSHF
jgi:hypothetical protein